MTTITQLPSLSTPDPLDELPIVDASEGVAENRTKRITYANLMASALPVGGKAADSDKLDGVDSAGYAKQSNTPSGAQVLTSVAGVPTWAAKAPDADKLDGNDSAHFLAATAQAADSAKLGNVAAANYLQTPSWVSFTPTITYAGGTTNPTSLVGTAKYFQIGKFVTFAMDMTLTRGSGDRTYIIIQAPVSLSLGGTGSCTHTIITSVFTQAAVYYSGGFTTSLGAAMARDGYFWMTCTYEAS